MNSDVDGEARVTAVGRRSPKRRVLLGLAMLFVLLGVVVFTKAEPKAFIRSVWFALSEDTEYAPDYSEQAFQEIQLGAYEREVASALGQPLSESAAVAHKSLLYAVEGAARFEESGEADSSYSFAIVTFDAKGRFVTVSGQIVTFRGAGAASVTFGDGANSLGITEAQIVALQGKSEAEIEALYGVPLARFSSSVVRWLNYSHSPGSTHYTIRRIGLDSEGRVSRKMSEIYWD